MTGTFLDPVITGRKMLRYKQSSVTFACIVGKPPCGQRYCLKAALRTPDHGSAGRGGANLRFPTGGFANGMPQNPSTNFPVEFSHCPAKNYICHHLAMKQTELQKTAP